MSSFSALEQRLGITFTNKKLLQEALTHRSWMHLHPESGVVHNERLEFLGDAVIELSVSLELFERFPQKPEGDLTLLRAALVNSQSLNEVAKKFDLEQALLMSPHIAERGRRSIVSDALESVVGAIFLDQGFERARAFVVTHIVKDREQILRENKVKDSKTLFQEAAQAVVGITPTYQVLEESGPDHQKHFKVGVFLNGELVATGEGNSKQEAETEAAFAALRLKHW